MPQIISQYTIDAFTDTVFKGNPAAVCLLDEWLDDTVLLNITKENNLSETAFVVPKNDEFELRWFTPKVEVSLCGHATLATAFALNVALENCPQILTFHTRQSGVLTVQKSGNRLLMDFPVFALQKIDNIAPIADILGVMPNELTGVQASERTGVLYGNIQGERMLLGGQAVLFAKSEIYI